MEKQLKDLSISELKALAYDFIASREQATASLQQVNQLIVNKSQEPKDAPKEEPKVDSKSK